MNWDTMKGKWSELEGQIKSKWAKLTDDDLALVRGKVQELVGRVQQRYGYKRDHAEKQVDEFIKSIPTSPKS